jgi:hypothetical protein
MGAPEESIAARFDCGNRTHLGGHLTQIRDQRPAIRRPRSEVCFIDQLDPASHPPTVIGVGAAEFERKVLLFPFDDAEVKKKKER